MKVILLLQAVRHKFSIFSLNVADINTLMALSIALY
jgi:hypothetical protein